MILTTQIKLILFSFTYGLFLAITLDLSCKFIYSNKKIVKIVYTIIYVLLNSIIYFYILEFINHGILHYYSFLCIVVAFILENIIVNKYFK